MSQHDAVVGGVGVVRVGDLEVVISTLSQGEETVLDRRLRAASADFAGDNYTRCRGILDAMRDNLADRVEAVREITRTTIGGGRADGKAPLSGGAFFDFRFGPAGLPVELHARGRQATPGLTVEGLRAVITEANADDVAAQLLAVIEGDDPKSTRSN